MRVIHGETCVKILRKVLAMIMIRIRIEAVVVDAIEFDLLFTFIGREPIVRTFSDDVKSEDVDEGTQECDGYSALGVVGYAVDDHSRKKKWWCIRIMFFIFLRIFRRRRRRRRRRIIVLDFRARCKNDSTSCGCDSFEKNAG